MMNTDQIETRYIATSVPLLLHRELKALAAEEGQNLNQFFRALLVERLEAQRAKGRRRRP